VNTRVKWLFGGLGTTVVGVLLIFSLDALAGRDEPAGPPSATQKEEKLTASKDESTPPKVEPARGPIDERQLVRIFRQYRDTVPVLKPDFEKLVVGRTVHLRARVRWTDFEEGKDQAWYVLDLDDTTLDVKCSVSAKSVPKISVIKNGQIIVTVGELVSINDDEAQVTVSSIE
jgi:hypothetical protein